MSKLPISIIKTLCYSEIFSYPLEFSELHKYLISSKKVTREELLFALRSNKHIFEDHDGYIFLRGSSKFVTLRKERESYSQLKLVKAQRIIRILRHIPTLKLIGISGSLSMNNAKIEDDIDLFFITQAHTVWISRFLVIITLLFLREKRSKGKTIAKDRTCPNMFLSEEALSLHPARRNMYTAHEISQLKVFHVKDDMYRKFLAKNNWVLKILPNSFSLPHTSVRNSNWQSYLFIPFEYLLFFAQFLYMRSSITNEKISLSFAMFHPVPNETTVQTIFSLKLKYWGAIFRHNKSVKNRHHLASSN